MFINKNLLLIAGAGLSALNAVATAARYSRRISFADKVVVITGGSRGLGLVLARQFARERAKVVLIARDAEELEAASREFHDNGHEVTPYFCDVTKQELVNATFNEILSEFGRIDVLVNNAGMIQVGPQDTMTVEDYRNCMDIHFFAPLYTTMAVVPHMKKRKFGRIVNITSIGGKVTIPHLLPYSASKFALVGFSEGLRTELLKDNIMVTTVAPGLMRTGSHIQATYKGKNKLEYALFSTMGALPILSTAAESAAKEIVEACRFGEAERIITSPAKMLAKVHAVYPELTLDFLGLVNRILPGSGGYGSTAHKGIDSRSRLSPNPATVASDREVVRNHENISFDHPTSVVVQR